MSEKHHLLKNIEVTIGVSFSSNRVDKYRVQNSYTLLDRECQYYCNEESLDNIDLMVNADELLVFLLDNNTIIRLVAEYKLELLEKLNLDFPTQSTIF